MSAAESPSALLERAATKLEDLAHHAPLPPWRMGGDGDLLGYGSTPIVYSEYGDVEVQWADGTFEWVCMASPALSAPLVSWLREAAAAYEEYGDIPADFLTSDEVAPVYRYVHAFIEHAVTAARRAYCDCREHLIGDADEALEHADVRISDEQ